jgi:hypothetical protein
VDDGDFHRGIDMVVANDWISINPRNRSLSTYGNGLRRQSSWHVR